MTASPPDLALLRRFHRDVFVPRFPDPDERESLDNMEQYLRRKAEGWYRDNNYHILLYLDHGDPVAGVICDYLADSNVGFLEFLVVASSRQRCGLGRRTLRWAEDALQEDSRRAGHAGWAYLLAEMDDPLAPRGQGDAMDPFERARIWHRWGFRKLRCPYVQPALGPDQEPVRNLLLLCKPGASSAAGAMPAGTLRDAVYGLARWAMRIDDPDDNDECRALARHLAGRDEVELSSLVTEP